MTEKEILVDAMKTRGFTQQMLADAAGLKRQTNVSEMLRSRSLRVDNFVKLLNAMGFEVIVREKSNPNSQNTWTVGHDSK